MKNEKGFSLIGVLVASGIMAMLMMSLVSLTLQMIKVNSTSQINTDIQTYLLSVRDSIYQDPTTALGGNPVEGSIAIKDPFNPSKNLANSGMKFNNRAFELSNIYISEISELPGKPHFARLTITATIQKDPNKIYGPSMVIRTIGSVFCNIESGKVKECSFSPQAAPPGLAKEESSEDHSSDEHHDSHDNDSDDNKPCDHKD